MGVVQRNTDNMKNNISPRGTHSDITNHSKMHNFQIEDLSKDIYHLQNSCKHKIALL